MNLSLAAIPDIGTAPAGAILPTSPSGLRGSQGFASALAAMQGANGNSPNSKLISDTTGSAATGSLLSKLPKKILNSGASGAEGIAVNIAASALPGAALHAATTLTQPAAIPLPAPFEDSLEVALAAIPPIRNSLSKEQDLTASQGTTTGLVVDDSSTSSEHLSTIGGVGVSPDPMLGPFFCTSAIGASLKVSSTKVSSMKAEARATVEIQGPLEIDESARGAGAVTESYRQPPTQENPALLASRSQALPGFQTASLGITAHSFSSEPASSLLRASPDASVPAGTGAESLLPTLPSLVQPQSDKAIEAAEPIKVAEQPTTSNSRAASDFGAPSVSPATLSPARLTLVQGGFPPIVFANSQSTSPQVQETTLPIAPLHGLPVAEISASAISQGHMSSLGPPSTSVASPEESSFRTVAQLELESSSFPGNQPSGPEKTTSSASAEPVVAIPSPSATPAVGGSAAIWAAFAEGQSADSSGTRAISSAILNPLAVALPLRTVASKETQTGSATNARKVPPGASGTTGSASSVVADADPLNVGSQTPFSVFFSDPGPGTEAVALSLPKILLPGSNSSHGALLFGDGFATIQPASVGAGSTATNGTSVASRSSPANGTGANLPNGSAFRKEIDPDSAINPSIQPSAESQAPASWAATSSSASAPIPAIPPAPPLAANSVPVQLPLKSGSSPDPTPASPVPAAFPSSAESLPTAPPGPVQVAQIASRVGQSEMRIGMTTSAFGNVEVRTTVHASDVGLTIGSEKGDLRSLLANEIPALTNSLQQQNLRLNHVNFSQGFASPSNGGGGGNPQQQPFIPKPAYAAPVSGDSFGGDAPNEPVTLESSGAVAGLSILA